MNTVNAASTDHRTRVHTEVRAPVESIIARLVTYAFAVVEVLIGIRFVLRLIGANGDAGFVRLIYSLTKAPMAPFNAILGTDYVSGATIEWSALVAIAIYALLAWGIVELIRTVTPRRRSETVERVQEEEQIES